MTEDETKQLVSLLKKLEPGFLPFEVFMQVARIVVMPILEFVPLRINDGDIEVLLLSRGADDPVWPNELHTPGTVIRATDTEDLTYHAFNRILKDELQGTEVSSPQYVGSNLHKSKRGMEQAQVFWVEVFKTPKVGEFYNIEHLPMNLMKSQQNFILEAAKKFRNHKKHTSKIYTVTV